ncbi:MAG: hypothetical protein V3U26_00940, partial [Dehalococcoidia bacterium]
VFAVAMLVLASCGGNGGPEEHTIDLEITERRVVGEDVIKVKQGDTVTLRWSTDEPLEVHLHGYDLEIDVEPGEVGLLELVVDATGRFMLEGHYPLVGGDEDGDHNSHDEEGEGDNHEEVTLMYLEVLPR